MTNINFDDLRARLRVRVPARIHDPLAAEAAVALILIPTPGDLEALFIRRAEVPGDPWSGHMALPGGRRQVQDRDLLATATRETEEEVGVVLGPEHFLGELDDFTPRTPHLPRIVVRPHVFRLPRRPELKPSAEVAAVVWLTLSQLREAYGETDVDVAGTKMRRQAFIIGETVVWGLTERIIKPFIDLLDARE